MKKLLALLGILGAISGYSVNVDKVQEAFASDEFTIEQKAEAINLLTDEAQEIYRQITEDDISF